MPLAAWKEILARTWRQTWLDNVSLVAAGVAFYGFLAIVPLLGLIVLAYGFAADPETVIRNMQVLTIILPKDVALLIGQQLMNAVKSSETTKGVGVLVALVFSLYGGCNGAGSIITALNIAYQEKEKRSLARFYLIALLMTIGAVALALLGLAATSAIAALSRLLPHASFAIIVAGRVSGYVAFALAAAGVAAALYRFAPSREAARWQWITPGSLFTALTWLSLTLLFGLYVSHVAHYNVTYGPLGAMIALLTWIYLSAYVLLIGAELNSEVEHQTAKDSTTGQPRPLGTRGAWAADNVADNPDADEQVVSDEAAPSLGAAGPPLPSSDQASEVSEH